jgi:hypothetical protein
MPSYINTGNGFDVLPAGGVFSGIFLVESILTMSLLKRIESELLKAKRVKPTMIFGYHKKPLTKNDRMKGQVDQYIYPPNLDWNSSFDVTAGASMSPTLFALAGKGLGCDGFLVFGVNLTEIRRYAKPNGATTLCEGEKSFQAAFERNWQQVEEDLRSRMTLKRTTERLSMATSGHWRTGANAVRLNDRG